MEKSIENIWKEGFLKSDELVAPKIKNLNTKKSIHIIDKIQRMMKVNIYIILVFAILNWGIYTLLGTPIAGGIIFILLLGVCWLGFKQTRTLKNIDANLSSYEYIKAFSNWLKKTISNNVKVMRLFYTLMFLAALMPIVHTLKSKEVIYKVILDSGFHLTYGIPTFMWIIALAIAILIYVFGGKIYRWDVNLVYGRVFKKLDELIADIEGLRT